MIKNLEQRFAAILTLHRKLQTPNLSRYDLEVLEEALNYSLGEQRKVETYFFEGLERDAKTKLRRKAESNSFQSLDGKNEDLEHLPIPELAIENSTPEHLLIEDDYYIQIRKFCKWRHELAESIFDLICEGYRGNEIAEKLSISESLVKKIRVDIKKFVSQLIK